MNSNKELEKRVYLYDEALHLLGKMLLCDRIKLREIPRNIRISSKLLYIYAFRISRDESISCERFISDLQLLISDILSLNKRCTSRSGLLEVLFSELSINGHKGEKSFVDFKKNIPNDILYEMQNNRTPTVNDLNTQFRKLKAKKALRKL